MTDINDKNIISPSQQPELGQGEMKTDGPATAFGDLDPQLLAYAELLFFAYRDFISDPDAILKKFGFGRAHHRVLHFVNRHPGMRVADLLDILKITKQSLARVLKQLIDQGYIAQREGPRDRRERRLYPTEKGGQLTAQLARPQMERIAQALSEADAPTQDSIRTFLYAMITKQERAQVAELLAVADGAAARKRTGKSPQARNALDSE